MIRVYAFSQNNFGVLLLLLQFTQGITIYTQSNYISQARNHSSDVNNHLWNDTPFVTLLGIAKIVPNYSSNVSTRRVKRDSSTGGKYVDASKMAQIKIMRLFLQMFKNLWASTYVGGAHPFHQDVPKPVVYLFKDKIVKFFFPDPQKTEMEDDKS